MPNAVVGYTSGKFGGPFDIALRLLDNASVSPTEGLWLPSRFAKTGSVELSGSMSTMAVSLLGTNQFSEPQNQFTITIGGSITAGDVVSIVATNSNIHGGSATVSYQVTSSDTTATVAATLAALMMASTGAAGMQSVGITTASAASVITASFPSIWSNQGTNDSAYSTLSGQSNATVFSGSSSGSSTETVTVAGLTTVGQSLINSVTGLGIFSIPILPRWMRARLTTLTGSGATINATFAGAA